MRSDPNRLLPIVAAYLPVAVAGAVLSAAWRVGATPDGRPSDMFLRGTALTPPLFLPAILVGAAATARDPRPRGRVAAAVVSLVGAAFLAGSTLNLPTDVAAARAAGTPVPLTLALAAIHATLAVTLLAHAGPRAIGRSVT
jgi:hypothetical protein